MLRSTQNELVQAGKLAMLGQMATGITHELNQPLAAIRAFADNARVFLARGQGEQVAGNLGHISEASARMGAIIGQLKGFARKDESDCARSIWRASVRASAFLLESEFRRHGVTLEIDTRPDGVKVSGDSVRIEQVLINLLRNALDAVEAAERQMVAITLARDGGCALVASATAAPAFRNRWRRICSSRFHHQAVRARDWDWGWRSRRRSCRP
jgi:two-component system C4-dicarboxylate transport sensor histidine kinase DctB